MIKAVSGNRSLIPSRTIRPRWFSDIRYNDFTEITDRWNTCVNIFGTKQLLLILSCYSSIWVDWLRKITRYLSLADLRARYSNSGLSVYEARKLTIQLRRSIWTFMALGISRSVFGRSRNRDLQKERSFSPGFKIETNNNGTENRMNFHSNFKEPYIV